MSQTIQTFISFLFRLESENGRTKSRGAISTPTVHSHSDLLAKQLNSAFYHDALYYNNYLNAVVDSFKHRELFGHLDFRCLRVGFDIRCFHGPAAEQVKFSNQKQVLRMTNVQKIKRDICWVVQFEANKKHLNWNVVLNTANADITLVITVSRKCYMTGIQCRR